MKKFTFILMTAVASLAFVNFSREDDKGGSDSLDCGSGPAQIKYCKKGDNYTVSYGGVVTNELPLGDQTWDEFRDEMQAICD